MSQTTGSSNKAVRFLPLAVAVALVASCMAIAVKQSSAVDGNPPPSNPPHNTVVQSTTSGNNSPIISGNNMVVQTTSGNNAPITTTTIGTIAGSQLIEGSGHVISEARPVKAAFSSVRILGAADVAIQQGKTPSVKVTTDDNLLPMVTTKVKGGTLEIGNKGSFATHHGIHVDIVTPALAEVNSTGSGNIKLSHIAARILDVSVLGSGNITGDGQVGSLSLGASGSGTIQLKSLVAGNVSIEAYGADTVAVTATNKVKVMASGASSVHVFGKPHRTSVNTEGAAQVNFD